MTRKHRLPKVSRRLPEKRRRARQGTRLHQERGYLPKFRDRGLTFFSVDILRLVMVN